MEGVLIIGASASVGRAIANRFLSSAARVIVTYCSKNAFESDRDIHALALDLSDDKSIDQFGRELGNLKPQLDTIVFLPGVIRGKKLEEYQSEEMEKVMAINFTGQAKVLRRLLPYCQEGAHILMVASISAQKGSYDPIYAASKGAILSFVKSIASSLAPRIRANALAPGLIQDSSMFQMMPDERRQFHRMQTPDKKFLRIEDMAEIIFDLSQAHWSHLNGACIDLNGGQYVR